ncbi:substrate-binding domain-containing protein [Sphingobacterium sp. DK4209]|uniref:Substrate-binding domain-containing protein n=1 Tax=Sphingobacterium zhuxiongii TaxID=2662364 RepID=A0A5Q0QBU3_9SPHI|nr:MULTISPECIES: LacI family DNA-binding transcriptional regulator [unclassified Sphingobacterium]MVZ66560.1 substrate-binding domain-containing protein [Sphingobacterium sp. DK4209]QGA26744.1 substrate-binding domain-containing protein [Sphingobacterium sp. dk4302]
MLKKGFGIKNIAEMLGISVSTVSRALRDAHDINPETKEKVLKLAKELNFKPNKNAAALASGSTKNIGVLIPFITNYYFGTVISGIQEEAYRLGYNIILFVTNDEVDREKQLIDNLDTASLDGLLISLSSNSTDITHFENLIQAGLPLVFFDRVPNEINASKVMQSDYEGAFLATSHLIKKGYKRIAHLAGPESLKFTQERLRGYLNALKQAQLPVQKEYIIHSGFSTQHGFADTQQLIALHDRPDAIFAANDRKAIGAIQALKSANINVGVDFGVIGFTNDPICTVIEPNLTTVEEPAFEIGLQSCQLLIKHIKNKEFEPRSVVIPCRLINRDSA